VFDRADNRMHTIKAVMLAQPGPAMRIVAALGGEAGPAPSAGVSLQEAHVVTAVRALAPLAAAHISNHPRQRSRSGCWRWRARTIRPCQALPVHVLGAQTL
jgi:hypothetical protein